MPNDFVNSEGVSVSLWTVGCHFRCPGCQNSDLWDFETVQPNIDDIVAELSSALTANGVLRKLSILGGEPLCPENRKLVKEIIDRLKTELPDLQVYVWTGYEYDELLSEHDILLMELLKAVNILVEGKFDISQRDTSLKMRGSKNQNILRLDNLQEK
jgi:anaerobic ribonucleoside-triphosphate reductase activating protein